jgi:hypothetical protein
MGDDDNSEQCPPIDGSRNDDEDFHWSASQS